MKYDTLNSDYLSKNPTWHVEDSPWKAEQILKLINRNKLDFTQICEVGCGVGEILNELSKKIPNGKFIGFEISPDAYAVASKLKNSNLKFANHDFLKTSDLYDLLLVMDVVEHVRDYYGFLDNLKNRSTYKIFHFPIDMTVYALVRNTTMRDRLKLGHLHYFSKETVLATLGDTDYEIIDWFYTPGIEINRKTFKQRFLNLFRKMIFKINKDFAVKYLSGYSMIVLAK